MSDQAPEAPRRPLASEHQPAAFALAAADLAHLAPSEIRQCVSDLLQAGQDALAQALSAAALARHPGEPDVLAGAAMAAQARQDWLAADDLLRRWVSVQGDATPANAWIQWVHTLHRLGEPKNALHVAIQGSRHHPDDLGLAQERQALERRWDRCQLMSSPRQRH